MITFSTRSGNSRVRSPSFPNLKVFTVLHRQVDGIWPYWIPEQAAAKNSFTWNGIWMLTAPNMAGKSTLMRSTTVVALLANAGLLAPVQGGLVPRYDGYFVRTASFDVPSEGKSSFAQARPCAPLLLPSAASGAAATFSSWRSPLQEMDDLHVLTSECGQRYIWKRTPRLHAPRTSCLLYNHPQVVDHARRNRPWHFNSRRSSSGSGASGVAGRKRCYPASRGVL